MSSPAQVFRDGPGYFNSTAVRGLRDGTGHVAMVVRVDNSSSFTVAEYNWHANGGGFGIMDYRRVSMNVGAVSTFIR